MNTMIRNTFLFLIARAHRSRLAAAGSALLALMFGRSLMTQSAHHARPRRESRLIEGEFRRLRD